jgi:hydrogenase expression/formation protein HypE
VGIAIEEHRIPVHDGVRAACEMLGYDPLYVANEGKLVAVIGREDVDQILEAMRAHPYAQEAAIIGEITAEPKGKVLLRTGIGGTRIVDMLAGEILPRIC